VIEALALLQVRHVTDAVVPGGLGGGAGGEDVGVELAGGEMGADRCRHDDVPAHRRFDVVVRERLREAGAIAHRIGPA
jgi:hypothetical protein